MAQAGYTPIQLYYSTTAAATPTAANLLPGELAINITDGKLYYEDNAGVVQTIAYKNVPLSTVTGTLAVANGGTGATTLTGVVIGNGTSAFSTKTNPSGAFVGTTDTQTLTNKTLSTGSTWSGNAIAIANGGTGATTNSAARTNLGASTLGSNIFTITNPSAITFPRFNADNTVSALSAADFRTAIGAGTGGGTVSSVAFSTGTTGLTVSGSPITTSGTITLAGTLAVANGGTGATTFTAGTYLKGNGTSAIQAQSGIPASDITSGTLGVARGGTGATSLTANNVLLGNGTSALQVVAPGTSGNVLTSNGTTWTSAAPAGGGFSNMAVITSSGNWTVPAGVTKVKVTVVGGGGNGADANTSFISAGGGGGGGAAVKIVSGLTPGATVSVTVGAATGTSSFGAHCSATGGASSSFPTSTRRGGAGGIGSGGDLNVGGSAGGSGGDATNVEGGGAGGSSIFGGGGYGGFNGTAAENGRAYGGGGGGGASGGGTGSGGAGASGVVVIEY